MKRIVKTILIGSFLMAFTLYSCKKEEAKIEPLPNTQLSILLSHQCDGKTVQFDSLLYTNESGSKYSVSRLEYYISGIKLYHTNGEVFRSNIIQYVNGREPNINLGIPNLPAGKYTGIDFLIGMAPAQNVSNSLDNTPENINMQWPEVIGGGYHFLKFEGRYLDSANINQGFTMHIGTNEMLIQHQKISINVEVVESVPAEIQLKMNINEWFKNPYTYDFNKDGNYTMAIPELMVLLKNNGYDTFTNKE
jgi:hypothetical protein